jgi:outer membrane assembly lipoprotein YfiO
VRALALVLTLAVPLTIACASGPNLSEDYGQTARENYELAVAEFNDKDWEEAIAYADFVRIRFPFSRYAVEAELLIARAEYGLKNYVTAQDAFRQFLRLHPTHKHVRNGWVAYMVAVAAYMAAPSSVPFLPPHYQRDQALLREAVIELEYFFDHHSGSDMEPFARKLEADVKRRLLEHELYVARLHLDRERPEAAIMRLEAAHDMYPGIGLDAEVLFLLGVTYLRIDEVELAREIFSELQMQYPEHYHGQQARLYLKYMQDRYGPPDPNRPRPDRSLPVPETPPQAKPEEFKDWRWRQQQRQKKRETEKQPPEQPPEDGTAQPEPTPETPPAKKPKVKQPDAAPEAQTPEPESPEPPTAEPQTEATTPEPEPENPEPEP